LRKHGAQLQLTDAEKGTTAAWLLGTTTEVSAVHFLGPGVGDEHISGPQESNRLRLAAETVEWRFRCKTGSGAV
jgi:hypothetical protein